MFASRILGLVRFDEIDYFIILCTIMISQNRLLEIANKYSIGIETLTDIFAELERPGLDPRESIEPPKFRSDILETKDLKIGDIVEWTVRNVVDFGVFVDIWLHNDGFVHKSQIVDFFVSNPVDVLSVWQQIKAKVIEINLDRDKISLSMKWLNNSIIEYKSQTNSEFLSKKHLHDQHILRSSINNEWDENTYTETKISWNITFS